MIGEECKKMSMVNEHIPKHQAESGNKPKKCVDSRKEETKTIKQGMVQLILKLAPISKHS